MQLFYAPHIQPIFELDENDSKHAVKVLRKQKGDVIQLMDGRGKFFDAEILEAHPKRTQLKVVSEQIVPEPACRLTLAIASTKNTERIEWLVEKAVEMGVWEIQLLQTQHSERKTQRIDRLERIAVSAAKQALQAYIPAIRETVRLEEFLQRDTSSRKLIAHLTHGAIPLTHVALGTSMTLLIGPEGDFSTEELVQAQAAGYQNVTLGTSRLRTETAGLVGCALILCR